MKWTLIFGVLSGVLIIVADTPYVINAYKGKTQPHRVTWFLFFILNAIGLANQAASGATDSLWLVAGFTFATFSIFLVSLPHGVGGYGKLDVVVLIGALIGILLWWWLDSPSASIIANIVVAFIAMLPTIAKSFVDPKSETKITWLIGALSGFFGVLSVGELDYILLLLPFYAMISQAAMYILLEVRLRQTVTLP